MEALKGIPDETVKMIRRTFELYNDGTYDRFMAEHGAKFEGNEDVVETCLPIVDKAIMMDKIRKMLWESSVEVVAGIENFLSRASEQAAG